MWQGVETVEGRGVCGGGQRGMEGRGVHGVAWRGVISCRGACR